MASPNLALPGVLFVGEDERARLVAHLGSAAGWMIPTGILSWSTEVSVVAREALNEHVRRDAKIVMPEEQIPPAKMPLTHQAAQRAPLVSVSSRLTQKLVDAGLRVHTVGVDRVTSSFYYIAEGGGEDPVRIEGDLVAAVGAMLGDRADNAAIERVLDGLVDRLLRSLSKDRLNEVALELAAALPRAAADGTGTQDVDLEAFEKELSGLVAASEKYRSFLQEIASKLSDPNDRRVDIPLFGDARKASQGPFELTVGDTAIALAAHERWLVTGPLTEPKPAPASERSRAQVPAAPKTPEPKTVKPAVAHASTSTGAGPATPRPPVAPISPPRPASTPPQPFQPKAPATRVEASKPLAVEAAAKSVTAEAASKPLAVEAAAKSVTAEAASKPLAAEAAAKSVTAEAASKPLAAEAAADQAASAPVASAPSPDNKPSAATAPPRAVQRKVAEPALAASKHKKVAEPASQRGTTQEIERRKGGLPWLWILIFAAAAFAAYWFVTQGR